MKRVLTGYIYGEMIKSGWQDKPASGRFPEINDSAIFVYRKKTPGLVKCKITLIETSK
jgi:hypothetical protein